MNCNREMIIMMIVIISGIITGQSQGAVTGDINCDLWLICCKAGSLAIEQEFEGDAESERLPKYVCSCHLKTNSQMYKCTKISACMINIINEILFVLVKASVILPTVSYYKSKKQDKTGPIIQNLEMLPCSKGKKIIFFTFFFKCVTYRPDQKINNKKQRKVK